MIVTLCCGEDWEGMYINDKLVAEDHTLDTREIFLTIKNAQTKLQDKCIHVCSYSVDQDWLEEAGGFPKDWSVASPHADIIMDLTL